MGKEHGIQNRGRNSLVDVCLNFRANTGSGWTGNDIVKLFDGSRLIRDPRPFSTGLPNGFADTFGITPIVITPDMVGRTIGVFHAIEYKTFEPGSKASELQTNFLNAIRRNGGFAGVARNEREAIDIALGRAA
jgi:hypothetical protein